MNRFQAVFTRVIKELLRDKRTLALMLLAPMLILTLMHVVFDVSDTVQVKLGVDDSVPAAVIKTLSSEDVSVKRYSVKDVDETLTKQGLDAFLSLDGTVLTVRYTNADPSETQKTKALIAQVLTASKLQALTALLQKTEAAAQQQTAAAYTVKSSYLYGDADSNFFDKILPVLIGFFIFFFVFLISGIALLKERTSGTLERLLATPIKRSELVLGYLAGYGVFAILQTVLIILFSLLVLKLEIAGSLFLVFGTTILLSLVALSMGIFISTFANSEFQMMQFIPLIVIPQVFFSGLISLDTMAPWVKGLSYIFPLSYAGNALSAIMIKGQGLVEIWPNLLVLVAFIIIFSWLNIIGLTRYRSV